MKTIKGTVILIFLITVGFSSYGQGINISKVQSKADKLFQVKNYRDALPLFLELEKAGAEVENLDYKLAKSLKESKEVNDRVKSLAYFEKINASSFKELPYQYYLDQGDAYFDNGQIEQALVCYNRHLKLVEGDKYEKVNVEKKIEQTQNTYNLMRIPKNVSIKRMGDEINSEYTEYNPVVSADEGVMAYTVFKPAEQNSSGGNSEAILITYNETGIWSAPKKVEVQTQNNYGTAGISADGQEMLIFIGDKASGSIFKMEKDGDSWGRPIPLGQNIQSKYLESTASLTPDGKTIYFASNRPGGYGGMDIYSSTCDAAGKWSRATNLGPTINTKANEDAPFIHPNEKLLFFTTDGHQGMGGNDIYKSEFVDGKWTGPKNMGYPINTTANDNYFTLIADGSRGYFSSDRKGGMGGQDIYMMDMPEDYETIPLTMIKGRILNADTGKPLPTKIYMVDSETKQKIDYVYHPDQKTGDYLVILPPNKSYEMIIESEGFLPYTLNIDVPNQTEFYELYQMIYLKTIKQFEVVVGQEVTVKNAFYNTQEERISGMRMEHEAELIENDSIDAYDLMSDLIEAGDAAGVEYLVELMLIKNPIDEVDFEDNNDKIQVASRVYYYDESDESKFEKRSFSGDTIYSLPTMFVTKEAGKQKNVTMFSGNYDKQLLVKALNIYFDGGHSDLDNSYHNDLDKILNELNVHPGLGIEISGYASAEGNKDFNKKLSNQRAISVLDYLNHRGIVRRRIIAKGYGVSENGGASKEESRRVEVRLVDLNEI